MAFVIPFVYEITSGPSAALTVAGENVELNFQDMSRKFTQRVKIQSCVTETDGRRLIKGVFVMGETQVRFGAQYYPDITTKVKGTMTTTIDLSGLVAKSTK